MKKILYLFDDINYLSGAQKVTFFQMKELSRFYEVHAFSLKRPLRVNDLDNIPIHGNEVWNEMEVITTPLKKVLHSKSVSFKKKINRICYSILVRLSKGEKYLLYYINQKMKQEFEKFDSVIVVSEASKLREMVANLESVQKIQWIHTDYLLWSQFSTWTRGITRRDAEIYSRFDKIILLSEYHKEGFLKKFPQLKDKAITIPNLIDGETIKKKAEENLTIKLDTSLINLVTVGRLEKEKAYDRILDICKKLKENGFKFCWYIVGDGVLDKHLKIRIKAEKIENCVKMLGQIENPYPLMKCCDWFILLSEYEGTPVTIDEAMVLGVNVIAADVGGIVEQLRRGTGGIIVEKESCYKKICECIKKGKQLKDKLEFEKRNERIINKIKEILG